MSIRHGPAMQTRIDSAVIDASPGDIWAFLTMPELLQTFSFGLTFKSSWSPGDTLEVRCGSQLVAQGAIVAVEAPELLAYRLDEPGSWHVDHWVTWQLRRTGPRGAKIWFIVDSLSGDPPDYGEQLLRNLRGCFSG